MTHPPGIHYGIPDHEYHADAESISKSGLDLIACSPRHYWHRYLREDAEPHDTPTFRKGKAFHAATFEPDTLNQRFIVRPKFSGEGARVARAEWDAEHADYTILNPAEMRDALAMRDALMAEPRTRRWVEAPGPVEASIYWTDKATGVKCRCRIDKIAEVDGGVVLVDGKSTKSAELRDIAKSINDYRYDVQDAFYSDGARIGADLNVLGFVFLFVESPTNGNPPQAYDVRLCEDSVEVGRMRAAEDLRTYAECLASGKWPGYGGAASSTTTVSLPGWRLNQYGMR